MVFGKEGLLNMGLKRIKYAFFAETLMNVSVMNALLGIQPRIICNWLGTKLVQTLKKCCWS